MYMKVRFTIASGAVVALAITMGMLASTTYAVPPGSDVTMKGETFSDACTRVDESWISFCNGYIQAVIDGLRKQDEICISPGTTRNDLVTIVEKEITASSHLRKLNAKDAVVLVLRRYYPCL
jgi:hypothetical protein